MTSALLPRAERRVGRLRVRAREEGVAQHASILLADALRTASLPFADQGQLLVVRKVSLGRISPFASAATLALQLELAMREARLAAVHFDSPGAGSANAVIFPSHGEALVALARAHARRVEPAEWFWRAAVRGWTALLSRPERWLALLEGAHELPEAAIISARIVSEALRAGVENELLSSIPPGRGAAWLRLEGWSWREAERASHEVETRERPRAPSAATNQPEVIDRWERSWGPVSERLVWLATILAVIENPARALDPRLAIAITTRLAFSRATRTAHVNAASEHGPDGSAETQLSFDATTKPAAKSAEAAPGNILQQPGAAIQPGVNAKPVVGNSGDETNISAPLEANAEQTIGSSLEQTSNSAPMKANAEQTMGSSLEEKSTNVEKNGGHPPEERGCSCESTSFAGLLFLVPILERLGLAESLAARPDLLESGFPSRLLRFVGTRVGMLPDDPLALALDCGVESERFFPRADLSEAAREILAFPPRRAPLHSPLIAWTTALRRWSRRSARQGLISLIRRPGLLAASPTHFDIFFALTTADLRLRRVALDVDPGWVPWLGRVVRFHYLDDYDRGH